MNTQKQTWHLYTLPVVMGWFHTISASSKLHQPVSLLRFGNQSQPCQEWLDGKARPRGALGIPTLAPPRQAPGGHVWIFTHWGMAWVELHVEAELSLCVFFLGFCFDIIHLLLPSMPGEDVQCAENLRSWSVREAAMGKIIRPKLCLTAQ